MNAKKRIAVLGGGFAGVYTAKHLEKLFKNKRDEYEIALISKDNYFTYTPMLSEVVGGTLGVFDSVSSLKHLLKNSTLYIRDVSDIDLQAKQIVLSPHFNHTDIILSYDYLVIALGNVTDFRNSPAGLHEHALPFKNLADAFMLRNRLIDVIATAATETDPELRKQLLTFVVGGGGFSGVEVVAEINDFTRKLTKQYSTILPSDIRVVLVHSKDRLVDKELSPSLGRYAEKILKERGVEIIFKTHLISATPYEAMLEGGERIFASTIISTVPVSANPVVEALPVEKIKAYIATDATLQVLNKKDVWALGDCAAVPSPTGKGYCPHTAQFAIRQARCVAENIWATVIEKPQRKFFFKELGMMASLGHRRAVAELFGRIKLSGWIAWIFWRLVYWSKLPGFARKIKVGASWLLDILIPQESVQLRTDIKSGITHLHFAKGEIIFRRGDVGDFLYIVVSGKVEILQDTNEKPIAILGKGEFFGEMALLNQKKRNATVRCLEDCELLAIRKADFNILMTNFGELREDFLRIERERRKKTDDLLPPLAKAE